MWYYLLVLVNTPSVVWRGVAWWYAAAAAAAAASFCLLTETVGGGGRWGRVASDVAPRFT